MQALLTSLYDLASSVGVFFTSPAFTALTSAVAGAFFGAYGAQRIADRDRFRERLIKEIRDTNAATNISFGICNSLLAVKAQHIKGLKEQFDAHKKSFLEFVAKRKAGAIPVDSEFNLLADFQTLSLPALPISLLQGQVFEKISVVGRPLNLTITLTQTLHGLDELLRKRNELIEMYKGGKKELTPALYFGLPAKGIVNEDYASSVAGIHSYCDDIIFFSQLLCSDLVEHGKALAKRFEDEFRRDAPVVSAPEFDIAKKQGLMPDPALYSDWHTKFVKKVPPIKPSGLARVWRAIRPNSDAHNRKT